MSLNDLITLALIALFVGFPLVQRFLRQGSGPQQPGEGTGERPPEAGTGREAGDGSGTRRSATETASADRSAPAQTTEAPDGASELERRLQEARKRVQQARQSGGAGRPSAAGPSRPAVDTSSRPLVKPRESESPGFLGREGVTKSPRKTAPPLQVSKRISGKRASKMSKGRVVSLKPDDIFRGIVWHQILGEPVSARKRRRRSLRDR